MHSLEDGFFVRYRCTVFGYSFIPVHIRANTPVLSFLRFESATTLLAIDLPCVVGLSPIPLGTLEVTKS